MLLHPVNLLILVLATWRLASLLAHEAGPFNLFGWFRTRIGVETDPLGQVYGNNTFADGILCMWCNSLWFGTLWTVLFYFLPDLVLWMALPLALSTLTIVLQVIVDRLQVRELGLPDDGRLRAEFDRKQAMIEQVRERMLREPSNGV